MKKFNLLLSLLLVTAFSFIANAQSGANDSTFNPGTGTTGWVSAIAIQSDGKIIIGGGFLSYNGIARNGIARLNTDGSLDGTFNPPGAGAASVFVIPIALQSDGKIIIGGDFSTYNGTTRIRIARLNADGSLDGTFNPGTGANGIVRTIALQSDGKIIIGGDFTDYNQTAINRIARLNVDGSLDGTFNPGTGASGNPYGTVNTIAIQSDGKIIIGGDFTYYNGIAVNRIARLNDDGSIDGTFNTGTGANGAFYYPNVVTIAIQTDGKIIIGGNFTDYNGTAINCIARLNVDGGLDTSFTVGTGIAISGIDAIAIQCDGKIIIGGYFTSYNGIAINSIARLNTNGSLDGTFNPGTGANSSIMTIAIQSDGKIIIGGWFDTYNGIGRNHVARIVGTAPDCTGAVGGNAVGSTSFCVSGTPAISASGYSTGTGSGYLWESSTTPDPNTASAAPGVNNNPASYTAPAPITTTTYYWLKVTSTSGLAMAFSNMITVTVYPPLVVSLNLLFDTLYQNSPIQTLTGGTPAGAAGVYSGIGVSGGLINPATFAPGNYSVNYSFTDENGCSASATDIFTIVPKTDKMIFYLNPAIDGNVTIVVSPDLNGGTAIAWNELGQKMAQWTVSGRLTTYQFTWAAGVYMIEIRKAAVREVRKLLIIR